MSNTTQQDINLAILHELQAMRKQQEPLKNKHLHNPQQVAGRLAQIDPKSYSASEKFYQDRKENILRHAEIRERPENHNEQHEATLQFRVNEITNSDTLDARAKATQDAIRAREERLRPSVRQGESEEEFRNYARGVYKQDRQ